MSEENILYVHNHDPRVKLILVIARYVDVNVRVELIDLIEKEVLDILNPFGKVPFLITPMGTVSMFVSILRYFARRSSVLYGKDEFDMVRVDDWLEWTKNEVELPAATLLYPLWRFIEADSEDIQNAIQDLSLSLKQIDDHCVMNTFLVANEITVADLFVAFTFLPLYTEVFDLQILRKFNNFNRWIITVLEQPIFKHIFGVISPRKTVSPYQFVEKKKRNNAPKKKKSQSQVIGLKPESINEEIKVLEQDTPVISDNVSYLELLNPSSFDLNLWKSKYANCESVRPELIEWFWENFDHSGYTLWISQYNFPEECTRGWYAANLVSGFFQRTDIVKNITKYAQASICILEKDQQFHIYGVWIFRGSEIPPEFLEHVDDTKYHTWTQVQPDNPENIEFVNDLWSWSSLTNWSNKGTFSSGKTWG